MVDSLTQQLSIDNTSAATEQTEEAEASPFEKFDPLLHFGFTPEAQRANGEGVATRSRRSRRNKENKVEILSISFVKKYIQYAKGKPAPVLTKGAADHIVNAYATLRNEQAEGNQKRVRGIFFYTGDGTLNVIDRPRLSPRVPSRHSSVSPQPTPKRVCRLVFSKQTRW